MYSSNNFIVPYQNTNIAIVFQDTVGRRTRGINICKYLNSGTEENIVWVLLEGNSKVILDFINKQDAQAAQAALKTTIDILQPNCGLDGSVPVPPQNEVVNKLLSEYVSLVNTNTVVPLQWYDIIDSNNNLGKGAGVVYRVLALTISDRYPQGIVFNTNEKVILDVLDYKIDVITNLNNNKPVFSYTSTVNLTNECSFIYAVNNSNFVLDTCNFITGENSTIYGLESNNIKARKSTITIENCNNCEFSGINLATLLEGYSDIKVDLTTTVGKLGLFEYEVDSVLNAPEYLTAYKNLRTTRVIGELPPNSEGPFVFYLKNEIVQANAEFVFEISTRLNFVDNIIEVRDFNTDTLLLKIDTNYSGRSVKFLWDNNNFFFYLDPSFKEVSANTVTNITVTTPGQTNFMNVLNFVPVFKEKSILTINGIVQTYGSSEDYWIDDKNIYWVSSSFSLETDDKISIYYE